MSAQPALRDRAVLYATATLRALTTGFTGVTLGLYLAELGLTPGTIGRIVSAGLAGAALAALLATLLADRLGRRRFLVVSALLGALGTLAFVLVRSPLALALCAGFGMLNGMGRDRGAALILEQAALPATVGAERRTRAIALYTMLQDIGHGLGALLAGLPSVLAGPGAAPAAYRLALILCAAAAALMALLYLRLGATIEAGAGRARQALSARSRSILLRLSALFGLDSLAGGFLTTALLSYFFFERFAASAAAIGALFFAARLLNALSHLAAAWLAARIGLVNTMVFTHIPSSLLLVTVAFAPSFPIAALLFLLREGLVEMDVPTRSSYVLAVVEPGERTVASGVTNLVRLGGWALAPALAGSLMQPEALYRPLIIGAGMKIAYDLLLWRAFRGLKAPEERS